MPRLLGCIKRNETKKRVKRLSMDEYLAALKTAATQLEKCVSSQARTKAARMDAECYMKLYGVK
jgi:hypothetical protein